MLRQPSNEAQCRSHVCVSRTHASRSLISLRSSASTRLAFVFVKPTFLKHPIMTPTRHLKDIICKNRLSTKEPGSSPKIEVSDFSANNVHRGSRPRPIEWHTQFRAKRSFLTSTEGVHFLTSSNFVKPFLD